MSEIKDLTRWNRAGRNKLEYIDGNAANFLEELRLRLKDRFPEWESVNFEIAVPSDTPEDDQTEKETSRHEYNRRLVEIYDRTTGDYAREIVRTFARACHILTGHINAYANESYLRTATQWEYVRRLVETTGYAPAPALSAITTLILEAKPGTEGVVKKGLQVRYTVPDGGRQIIFETLRDVFISSRFSNLRVKNHQSSENKLIASTGAENTLLSPWLVPNKPVVAAGDLAVIVTKDSGEENGCAVRISGIDTQTKKISLTGWSYEEEWKNWRRGACRLRTVSRWKKAPWINGDDVIRTDRPHGLTKGAVVAWETSEEKWVFARVTGADERGLRLETSLSPPSAGAKLFEASSVKISVESPNMVPGDANVIGGVDVAGNSVEIPADMISDFSVLDMLNGMQLDASGSIDFFANLIGTTKFIALLAALKLLADGIQIPSTGQKVIEIIAKLKSLIDSAPNNFFSNLPDNGKLIPGDLEKINNQINVSPGVGDSKEPPVNQIIKKLNETVAHETFILRLNALCKGTVIASSPPPYIFPGNPGNLAVNEWAVGEVIEKASSASEKRFRALQINQIEPGDGSFSIGFRQTITGALQLLHADFRCDLGAEPEVNPKPLKSSFVIENIPPELKGRPVLLCGCGAPHAGIITGITEDNTITLDPPPPQRFTVGETVIHGNSVLAGHGQTRPPRLIGVQGALTDDGCVRLDIAGISTIPDHGRRRGFSPDLVIETGGRIWQQVDDLSCSAPADYHYELRCIEQGYLKLRFGDGIHGRSLPPGVDNIRVTCRVGAGRSGNLAAGSLTEMVSPHPLVYAVHQPSPSSGGDELEDIECMRRRAPAATFALERAVSEADFAALAETWGGISHASSFLTNAAGSGSDIMRVVVIPAGGAAELAPDSAMELRDFQELRAMPTVRVRIEPYKPVTPLLSVNIRIDYRAFRPDEVCGRVLQRLLTEYSAERRGMGKPIYLSELYETIETVDGVTDSTCFFTKAYASRQIVTAAPDESVFLTKGTITLTESRYIP